MSDYLIVGAGLTGMLAARELRLAGAEVSIVERGDVGQESSWAGGGILSSLFPWRYPEPVSQLVTWSMSQYPSLAQELKEASGIDPEYVCNGMLMPGAQDVEAAQRWADQFGVSLATVSEAEVADLEPQLEQSCSGLWMPEVGQLRNPRMLQALHRTLINMGVVFHSHMPVTSLLISNGRINGVTSDKGELRANNVVIAGGAWSQQILGELGQGVSIEPVRGQMLLLKSEPGWLSRIVLTDDCYLIPRRDGHILIGSTMERVGFNKSPTAQAREHLYNAALDLVPDLEAFPLVKHWAGLRPGSPNGIPFIGAHPDVAGLYISAGHFRNGVAMGPASGHLLGDLILGRSPIVDPVPFKIKALP